MNTKSNINTNNSASANIKTDSMKTDNNINTSNNANTDIVTGTNTRTNTNFYLPLMIYSNTYTYTRY